MSASFYRAFEDRYRGSRELIKDRLRVYLPFLEPLAAAGPAPALDLGCGRGEWLELLGEAGFAARGVDLDEGMLAACRERGLDVVNGDAIGALRDAPNESLAVVSAFHLVEHISFEQVQELIAQALRALRPGGLLIMETPNPENLVVGTSSFYDDPSHIRPLPPKLLAFAVEFGGFARHSVLRLQEDSRLHEPAPPRLFDVLAGASPDYSVIGQKAGHAEAMAPFDTLFATPRGIDLHALAERYQQKQDEIQARMAQDAASLVGLDARQREQAQAAEERFGALEATVAELRASLLALASDLAHSDAARNTMAGELAQLGAAQATLAVRVEHIEATMYLQGERAASRLRSRIVELEQTQQASDHESARLAQHVAWIEGRLTHAEAEAAALRHHLAEVQQRRAPLRASLSRLLERVRRQPVAAQVVRRLRQLLFGLLRRLIQLVLRSPALKRTARTLVARFPGLRARLLRLLYTPAPGAASVEAPADPLTTQMSPRSLAIYRELLKATKNED